MRNRTTQVALSAAFGTAAALLISFFLGRDHGGGLEPIEDDSRAERPQPSDAVVREPRALPGRPDAGVRARAPVVAEPPSRLGRPAGAAHANEPDGAADRETERPLAWCFESTVHHDIGSDSRVVWNGSHSAVVVDDEHVAGDREGRTRRGIDRLWQVVDATPYRGKWLEVSVHVKTGDHDGGVFLQSAKATDADPPRTVVGTPRIRPFRGSDTSWTETPVSGYIPPDADFVYYGVFYYGAPPLWVDDVRVRQVGPQPDTELPATPYSAWKDPGPVLPAPTNLDFEFQSASRDGVCSSPGRIAGEA
jgi:hypothetical protein